MALLLTYRNLHVLNHAPIAGWAEVSVGAPDAQRDLMVSDLSDALGDLLGAVVNIADGDESARVSWCLEPQEFRWSLAREDTDFVSIRFLTFPDWPAARPDSEGDLFLSLRVSVTDLVAVTCRVAEGVLAVDGPDYYRRAWGHPFPMDRLERLRGWQQRRPHD